jgi:glycerol-3-phosphate acyltransferase PlsY
LNEPWFYTVWIAGSYLLGSVVMGILIARVAGLDIRKFGTGNPGAANVWRELGAKYGIAVFLLDIAKGAAVTVPLYLLDIPCWVALASTGALLTGQFFPVFFRFKGGTGMAAMIGATAGLLPWGVAAGGPAAIAVIAVTRNTGWAGAVFLFLVMVVGGIVHRDGMALLGVWVGSAAVFIKGALQYRRTPPPEQRPRGPAGGANSESSRISTGT